MPQCNWDVLTTTKWEWPPLASDKAGGVVAWSGQLWPDVKIGMVTQVDRVAVLWGQL